ncbi:MAG: RDD family protein [Propionibacteriaceae bacterium]|jgi:uncharacterized RDD family membrane protein YckC|nr:RDD family protein [Propionibacteriaceae bacterium]
MTTPAAAVPRDLVAPAGPGIRLLAYAADLVIIAALVALTWPLHGGSIVAAALLLVELYVVLCLTRARTGRTPGSLLTHTVAVAAGTSDAPGFGPQAIRSVLFGLLHATVVGPAITIALSKDGQDWIDRFAGTQSWSLRADPETYAEYQSRLARRQAPQPQYDPAMWAPPASQSAQPRIAPYQPGSGARQASADRPKLQYKPPPTTAKPYQPTTSAGPQVFRVAPPPATGVRPAPASRPTPAPAPAPGPAPAARSSEGTRRAPQVVAQPAPAAPAPAIGHSTPPVFLNFDDGKRERVLGTLVLGRQPNPAPGERPVTIEDQTLSVSRTHLRVGIDGNGVWVEDAYSANGSTVGLPGQAFKPLPGGRRTYVSPGTVVGIGDRKLTIAAESASLH